MPTDVPSRKWLDRGVVIAGSATAGIGAFLYVVIATRTLGLEDFSPVSQLWIVWAIASAVVTFSTQIVTVRREVLADSAATSRKAELVPLVALLGLAVPILFIWRVRIFGDATLLWPLIGAIIPLGSYVTGKARGRLAVHGSAVQLAGVIGGENLVRAGIAVALAILGAGSVAYALAILAGYSVALIGARPPRNDRDPVMTPHSQDDALLPTAASVAGVSNHLLLVAAPTLIAVTLGPPSVVSAMFVVMAVYRAPYQLALGLIPSITRSLTERMPAVGSEEIRHLTARVGGLALIGGAMAALLGATTGEPLIAPIFQAQGVLDPIDHSLGAALPVVATATLVFSLALLTLAQSKRVIVIWGLALLVTMAAGVYAGPDATATLAVMVAGLTATAVGLGLSLVRTTDGTAPSAR